MGSTLEFSKCTTNKPRAIKLYEKLSTLKFFDPACGCGNFLIIAYRELRLLENQLIAQIYGDQRGLLDISTMCRVTVEQFYGIEINDFAVSVAKTALWIAESQILEATKEIVYAEIDFLPLKSYTNIVEGNALALDWEEVVPKDMLKYIIGNPPFVGYTLQTKEQKISLKSVYVDEDGKPYKTAGKVDFVAGWYFKASQLMVDTAIQTAFVSTNSITQGEQVSAVFKPLYNRFGIQIDFEAMVSPSWIADDSNKDGMGVEELQQLQHNVETLLES